MLIDTHCHLNLEAFKDDYREAIDRAFSADVKALINVGADFKSSKRAVEIANEFEKGVYATVGLHPSEACPERSRRASDVQNDIFNEEKFIELAKNPKVVAIGEIGLDYFYNQKDEEAQKELLNRQIKIANQLGKPIVLHCREAYNDLIALLMTQNQLPKAILHCFTGDWKTAEMFLDMGLYFSFTGIICFTKNEEQLKVVKNLPLEKIMIETDSPWLAPPPHRGDRNEPAFVTEVAKKIAEIKNISLEKVAETTAQTAKNFFKFDL